MSYTIYTDPPQSRNEAIIKSTIDGTQYTDPPQSRIEDLLIELKAAVEGGGGGGTTNYNNLENRPQINSHTLEGDMSFADLEIDETPTEDSTNAVSSGGVYAGLTDKIDKSSTGYQTITGNPLEFDSLSPQIVRMKCDIESSQDLHGYDKPWAGGEGKNKLPMTVEGIKQYNQSGTWSGDTYTVSGVSFTINTDGDGNVTGISTEGRATSNIFFNVTSSVDRADVPENFVMSGCPSGGVAYSTYQISLLDTSTSDTIYYDTGDGAICTRNAFSGDIMAIIRVGNGTEMGGEIFRPMIRLATETDPTFEPYSNICPIAGADTIDIDVTGGENYTIDLDGTRYGGQLDVVSGVLTLTHGEIVIDEVYRQEWLLSNVYQFDFPTNFEPQNVDSEVPTGLMCNLTEFNSITLVVFNGKYGLACSKTSGVFFVNIGISNLTDMNAYLSENPLQVVYELATPQTIQLTPTQVWAVQGGNTITVSVDGVEAEIHSSNYATLKDINDLWEYIKQSPQGSSDGVKFGASNLEMIGGTMA